MKRLILPALLVFSLLWGGMNWIEKKDARGVADFLRAYGSFMKELAFTNCTRAEQVEALARDHGWKVTTVGPPPAFFSSDGATDWRRVLIEPGLPFSKEPGVRLAFNAQGCMVRWSY